MGALPRYVMLDPGSMPAPPPPNRRNVPRYHQHDHHSGCSCMQCFCCCYCCIFILMLLFIATLGFLVFFLNPKLPRYTLDTVSVKNFDMQNGSKLYAELNIVLKAENPNDQIALEYGKNSSVNITYSDNQLCTGQVPSFLQPPKNTTMMNVVLKGKSDIDSQTQHDLMENQKEKKIPFDVKVRVPVMVVIHGTQLKEIPAVVKFKLTVDTLQPGEKINAVPSDFKYGDEV